MEEEAKDSSLKSPQGNLEDKPRELSPLTTFAFLWLVVIGLVTLFFSFLFLQQFYLSITNLPFSRFLNVLTVIHRFLRGGLLLIISLIAFRIAATMRSQNKDTFSSMLFFLMSLAIYLLFSSMLFVLSNLLFMAFISVFVSLANSVLVILIKKEWSMHKTFFISGWAKLSLAVFVMLLVVLVSGDLIENAKTRQMEKLIDLSSPPKAISAPGVVVPEGFVIVTPEQSP